jgi:hypothetical protein
MKNGTPILWQRVFRIPVSRLLTLLLVCAGLMTGNVARSQCGAGTNPVTLNWDILDYLHNGGTYLSDDYIENTTFAYTQNFAFGHSNRLTIGVNSNFTLGGEVATHTADLANYTGEDVMYTPTANGANITLTFENDVANLNFTIYDIEQGQVLTITAINGVPANQVVNVATQPGSILVVSGTPTSRIITAAASNSGNGSNIGSATISVAGPVRSVNIVVTNRGISDREFYLSDINACMTGNFPLNYYAVAQPFTGQPGYVLHAFGESVYYVNPATGFTRHLFTDAAGPGNINSLAYDPYNRFIYYVYSLTSSGEERMIKRWDVNTGTPTGPFTTILADIESIGIPTTDQNGAESGSAGFYNGSYYIGIETANSGRNSGREATIWRIDFNGSNIPYRSSQVFAQPIDSAGLLLHDWSDFVMYDGVLYNFDAAENDRSGLASTDVNQSDIYHVDMMTGNYVRYRKPGHLSVPFWYPGQPAINWAGQVVQVFASSGSAANAGAMPGSLPYITNYNGNGTIGSPNFMFSTPAFTPASPSLGDAGEAFRPRSDFGDAPATFDPVPLGVATHEVDPLIRLGATVINEWNKTSSALANFEGAEENGIGAAPNLNYDGITTYTFNVSYLNNTGGQATITAWLDYDFDGTFDPFEGRSVTVNSSGVLQSTPITWTGINVPMTSLLNTFLRIRITRIANGMSVNTPNGWFSDGEVEDYPVVMGTALPKDMQSFNLKKQTNATVDVKWSINVQQEVNNFEILRSSDNDNWTTIGTVSSRDGFGLQNYTFNDLTPAAGTSYYRIRINYQAAGTNKLSEVRSVKFDVNNGFIRILPNPAQETAELQISSTRKDEAVIRVYDRSGRMVMNLKQGVDAGMNSIRINNLSKLADGVYTIRTIVNGRTTSNQLIIKKQ